MTGATSQKAVLFETAQAGGTSKRQAKPTWQKAVLFLKKNCPDWQMASWHRPHPDTL
jgi:hypothetical protein